jgi:hypothetical protein
MDNRKRQTIVFLGFMTMLVAVFLFIYVFNNTPPPQGPEVNVSTGNQTGIIGDAIGGWKGMISDAQKGMNAVT